MTLRRYYLERIEYLGKLEKVIQKISGHGNIIQSSRSDEQAYFINDTEALFFYNGKNTITLGARNNEKIEKTKSKLEKISGVRLIPIK